jgi:hypothetical protein
MELSRETSGCPAPLQAIWNNPNPTYAQVGAKLSIRRRRHNYKLINMIGDKPEKLAPFLVKFSGMIDCWY